MKYGLTFALGTLFGALIGGAVALLFATLRNALRRRGFWPDAGITNPCLESLPAELADDERLQSIWEGLDNGQVWDSHAHLIGMGDCGSGIRLHREYAQSTETSQLYSACIFS